VQAEVHVNSDGEEMEVLGLILPDGGAAVALMEDVDLVEHAIYRSMRLSLFMSRFIRLDGPISAIAFLAELSVSF
ncbi:MAG: hypothetical protein ACK4HV_04960, partial [Parachlamydiaceae bacterium]